MAGLDRKPGHQRQYGLIEGVQSITTRHIVSKEKHICNAGRKKRQRTKQMKQAGEQKT
jgi:hypothetical protein